DDVVTQIVDYAKQLEYPLCLKAANWSKGKGVCPVVETEQQFRKFLSVILDALSCKTIILEENTAGDDFRSFVVGDKVSGVIQRLPANITGDGISTVKQLIRTKNDLRKRNPYLKNALIRVDEEVVYMISKRGYTLQSIIPASELLYLREKSNASAGGDSIDSTDKVSTRSKQLAIDAIKAIPGISHGGVDILLQNPYTEQETGRVIEINQSAEMGLHLYPAYGDGTYPPTDIIDYYFPEEQTDRRTWNWYFNWAAVSNLLNKNVAKSISLTPVPDTSNFIWVEVTYAGNVQGVGLRKWIVQQAKTFSVHGDVRNTPSSTVVLRASGRKENILPFLKQIKSAHSPGHVESTKTRKTEPFRTTPNMSIL